MRVITGTARGRRLKTLDGDSVRPTTDKVKESIFNIIQFDIEGSRVLDMFCGCGQLGIEALSRGAVSAVFADISRASISVTEENLEATGFRSISKTVLGDSLSYLDRTSEMFDIAFLDPPYAAGLLDKALSLVCDKMSDYGTIICEHPPEVTLPEEIKSFTVYKKYRYGKINVTTYKKDN